MRHYRAISIVIQPAHSFPILLHHIVAVNQYPVPCHDETAHLRINHMVRTPPLLMVNVPIPPRTRTHSVYRTRNHII
jgi:hypothetical protein